MDRKEFLEREINYLTGVSLFCEPIKDEELLLKSYKEEYRLILEEENENKTNPTG